MKTSNGVTSFFLWRFLLSWSSEEYVGFGVDRHPSPPLFNIGLPAHHRWRFRLGRVMVSFRRFGCHCVEGVGWSPACWPYVTTGKKSGE